MVNKNNMSYKAVKYPRVLVSNKRHKALSIEADKRQITVAELVEEKLSKVK